MSERFTDAAYAQREAFVCGALSPWTSSAADSHASKPAWRQPLLGDVSGWSDGTVDSGASSCASCASFSREQSSWKTPIRSGSTRCREIWRHLATAYPDTGSRLAALVRRIYAGECSLLPTLTARDWKSIGRQDHPRLKASRGLPLNETLGCNLSPEFCEWMMGFPAQWTDVIGYRHSATPLFPPTPNGSADASSKAATTDDARPARRQRGR